MKVSQTVKYYLDYHKMNSKKKYDKESRVYTFQVPEPVQQQGIRIHNIGGKEAKVVFIPQKVAGRIMKYIMAFI